MRERTDPGEIAVSSLRYDAWALDNGDNTAHCASLSNI
jgi:hypothetical protein